MKYPQNDEIAMCFGSGKQHNKKKKAFYSNLKNVINILYHFCVHSTFLNKDISISSSTISISL